MGSSLKWGQSLDLSIFHCGYIICFDKVLKLKDLGLENVPF